MNAAEWLNWFPIALAITLAAALLGRRRATPAMVLGALYWVVLSSAPGANLGEPRGLLEVLVGAVAIVALGWWVGGHHIRTAGSTDRLGQAVGPAYGHDDWTPVVDAISDFDNWLAANRQRPDPWPDFGEFVRSILHRTCQAKHIRAYRLLTTDDEQLYPLRLIEPEEHDFPSARAGIVGHVVTTAKSYYAGDPAQGDLVDSLAVQSEADVPRCAWCFAVRLRGQTIGVVRASEMDAALLAERNRLRVIEGIITLCWTALTEMCRSRLAGHTDPISGVLTHRAFTEAAERALGESYSQSEPVALVNVNLGGLRTLADSGQWDLANQMVFKVSSLLQVRIRQDDEIGVFDGSRFLLLLRRVDSELAMLIVRQLMDKLTDLCGNQAHMGKVFSVRCGVAGSGLHQPTLRTLISRATANCQEACRQNELIVSDLPATQEVRST